MKMLVFVTEDGGRYAWRASSDEEYEAAVRDGHLSNIPIVFCALVSVERNHDFYSNGPREDWADLAAA